MPIHFDPIERTYTFSGWDIDFTINLNNCKPVKPIKKDDLESQLVILFNNSIQQTSRKILIHIWNEGNILPTDEIEMAVYHCDKSYTPSNNWWVLDDLGLIP